MTPRLEYRVAPQAPPNARVYELSGVMDSSKAVEGLSNALRGDAARHLVLNFQRVTYVNSTGFGILIELVAELRDAGKVLYFTDPHPRVRVVFEQLGGDELPICGSADAMAKITAASLVPPPQPKP